MEIWKKGNEIWFDVIIREQPGVGDLPLSAIFRFTVSRPYITLYTQETSVFKLDLHLYCYLYYKFLRDELIDSMDNSNRAVPHSNRANLSVNCVKWLRFVNITVINTCNYKGRIRINRCTCKTGYNDHSGVREIDMHSTVVFLLCFLFCFVFLVGFIFLFFFIFGFFFAMLFVNSSHFLHV